jgi:hypothetical protein
MTWNPASKSIPEFEELGDFILTITVQYLVTSALVL